MNRLQIDTLDIIAAVIGAVLGMFLAFGIQSSGGAMASMLNNSSDLIDLLIGGPAFAMLGAKRLIWPTRPLAPGSNPILRMFYLLSGIAGTLLLIGAVVSSMSAFEVGASLGGAWATSGGLVMAGLSALALAVVLEKVGLERVPASGRRPDRQRRPDDVEPTRSSKRQRRRDPKRGDRHRARSAAR